MVMSERRRASRVFGVVKGVDGARVLRSGRRLFPESGDSKLRRPVVGGGNGEVWFHNVIKNTNNRPKFQNGIVKCKENGWAPKDTNFKEEKSKIFREEPKRVSSNNSSKRVKSDNRSKRVRCEKKKQLVKNETENRLADGEDRMFGAVYTRKRYRKDVENRENLYDKMFGKHFSRRQRRKRFDDSESLAETSTVLAAVVESSCTCGFECLLKLILKHMKRAGQSLLDELAVFLSSEPISSVLASNGIRFLMDYPTNRTGVCKFFGMGQCVPLFSVDFSAVPFGFMSMHESLMFRVQCYLSYAPGSSSLDSETSDDEMLSESEGDSSNETKTFVPEVKNSGIKLVLHPSVRSSSRLTGRNTHHRNGLNSRGIQKRRSSLRRRRARTPPIAGMHKANGALVSDLIISRKNGIPFSSVVSKKPSSSQRSVSPLNLKRVTPVVGVMQNMDGVKKDVDSLICSANILVIEADRCCRIEGAFITLEMTDSREWVLAVKKDGSIRYTHVAQKNMKTHSSNRVTHDIIWTADENWKLEFRNKHDWCVFRDLYKECSDRNVALPNSKTIPVPGVCEVSGYEDSNSGTFTRPETYISVNHDEVTRALAKTTANYDMDYEDEEWLKKFNNEHFLESEHKHHIPLSVDNFELMIDKFERSIYCSTEENTDGTAVVNLCVELGSSEVVEAVYAYWMKKRKHKKPLLRVFQAYQPKKASLIPKPALRKKRSFKRQVSHQFGRGKQPNLLQVMAAEHDAWEEQNAKLKVEEARDSAKKSVEAAVAKRQRAQLLMENADLATYKALMALRIAEVAHIAGSTEAAAACILDECV